MVRNNIVIGLDQSYADTGISIGLNGKLKCITNCYMKPYKNNTAKRQALNDKLNITFEKAIYNRNQLDSCSIKCVIERIRLQSSKGGNNSFLNIDYIKSIGALNALIVDTASKYGIEVYSVDTRSWKSQVVGTSKPLDNPYHIPPEKWPTIQHVVALGFGPNIRYNVSNRKKYCIEELNRNTGLIERYTYNDNKADSACICLYGFLPEKLQKLQLEH